MADKKRPKGTKVETPVAVARFPHLNKPDRKFDKDGSGGHYVVDLVFKPTDKFVKETTKLLQPVLDAFVKETLAEKPKLKKKHSVAPIFTPETDKEGEETGNVLLKAKLKEFYKDPETKEQTPRRPAVFDAKGVELKGKKLPQIWSGSELRLSVSALPYLVESSGQMGISFRLGAVQIIKLVSGGGPSFGAYEGGGYEAGGDEDDDSSTNDADDSDDDGDDEGDGSEY